MTAEDKIVVIRNGVAAPPDVEEGQGRLRALLGVDGDCRIIAMVSRLRRPKRPEDLLHAAALLARGESGPPFRVVFVGGGPLEPTLRMAARKSGVEGLVTFLGDRLDVPTLMPDVDVAVLASGAEGMPYSVLEAMAAGKAVVGTRAPWAEELILEGQNGYSYRPGHADELAAVLGRLLDDGDLRRRLGAEGRRMAMTGYTVERMVQETGDLYRRLMSGTAGA